MKKHNVVGRRLSHNAALLNEQCKRIAGRAGVIAALVAFIAAYLYGISTFGIIPGIALGWLPCGIIAWLTAIVVATLSAPLIHQIRAIVGVTLDVAK